MAVLDHQKSVRPFKKYDFAVQSSWTSMKFSTEALNEQIQGKNVRNCERRYWKGSLSIASSPKFFSINILMSS